MDTQTYVAFLRGINIGKHHKVPMAELRHEIEMLEFKDVRTLLNSGNVIFKAPPEPENNIAANIASHLEKVYEFPIPVVVQTADALIDLINSNPFDKITETEITRFYFTFLKVAPEAELSLPWTAEDKSVQIIEIRNRTICSAVDFSQSRTPKAMHTLEKLFGKDITTRNRKTVNKIVGKIT